jgi:polysaccharide chain length determinant protein (PEP-CTERM system associated)
MISIMDEIKIAIHGIWQRRWLAMAAAWGLCLLGWLVVTIIPNSYESRSRILVDLNDVLPTDGAPLVDRRQRLDELRQTINSARNLEQVAVASGMIDRAADDRARAAAAATLQEAIEVKATQDNIFELIVQIGGGGRSDSDNAQLATRIIESTIAVFRDEQVRGGTADAERDIRFLDAQMRETEGRLRTAEAARAQFEGRNFGLLPGAGSPSVRLESARAEIGQIDTQLISAQSALGAINAQISSTPTTISVPGIGPTGISMAQQQLASSQAELASMRARGLTSVHPDVMALEAQIVALRNQVARQPSAGGSGATSQPNPAYSSLVTVRAERQGQVAALQARRAALNAEISGMTVRQTQEPGIAAEYERLNRAYNVQREQFDRLQAQRERIRLRGETETTGDAVRIDILDAPTRPRSPASPNRPLLLLGVLFMGLAGGIVTALAMSQLQTTYPTAARLAKASGLPVIGSITEILTDELVTARRAKLRRFALAGGGLVALCALLLTVEFIQRGMVG